MSIQTGIALLSALIGASLLTIFVGLMRRGPHGWPKFGDLLTAAVCGAIFGGLIGYAIMPQQGPVQVTPSENALLPGEAQLAPAAGHRDPAAR